MFLSPHPSLALCVCAVRWVIDIEGCSIIVTGSFGGVPLSDFWTMKRSSSRNETKAKSYLAQQKSLQNWQHRYATTSFPSKDAPAPNAMLLKMLV